MVKFNGVTYYIDEVVYTKSAADRIAKQLRSKGYKARVKKEPAKTYLAERPPRKVLYAVYRNPY